MDDYEKLRDTVSASIVKLSKLTTELHLTLFKPDREKLVISALMEVIENLGDSIDRQETQIKVLRQDPILSLNDQIERLDLEYYELYNLYYQARHAFAHRPDISWDIAYRALDDFAKFRDWINGGGVRFTESPAHKNDLTNDMVKAAYEKTKSYRGAAKILNCSPKTVKDRLVKMGYFKKDVWGK